MHAVGDDRRRSGRKPWRAGADDTGSVTLEAIVLLPLALLVLFFAFELALAYIGSSVAGAAAQRGAREAAAYEASNAEGAAVAEAWVADLGAGMDDVSVTVSRNADSVTVTVSADTLSIIPQWSPSVTRSATMPLERVTG